ncbi:methylenetetrahydrofolate reductase [Candidatus Latescibacterota bacterium]
MNESITKTESRLEKILASSAFAVTSELGPPKSADTEAVRTNAGYLKDVVDAVNITDNQTAIVRMSSIGAGVIAMGCGLEPVIQITCRDRNRLAIQSDLLGAYALGIKNVLCLTGDHQCFGNHAESKNVFDIDSIQLLDIIRGMRENKVFQSGEELRNSKKAPLVEPKMFIGAAANPFGDPFAFRVSRLAKKINAGADFIQTQCIYDMDRFKRWMDAVRERGLHEKIYILAGITPLKSVRMATHMRDNVAGLSVPDELIKRLEDSDDPKTEGHKIAVEQIEEIKKIPGISGVHIMAIGGEKTVASLAEDAGLLPRPKL